MANLFIGSLAYATTDESLEAFFATVGPVKSARVITDRDTNRSKGFGFVEFEDEAIDEIAKTAFDFNLEMENIGARRLQTVMSRLLNEFLFDVPDKINAPSKIRITKQMVNDKLSGLITNKDLSEYIL